LCELLGVARSGYYVWCQEKESQPAAMNEELSKMIDEIYTEHKGRYGSPRMTQALRQKGYPCNHKRVERLMRCKGLQARTRKRWKPRTTDSQHPHPIAPNLLLERAAPQAINEVWVEDITYLPTAEGWLYLAGVLDLFSRRVIGWSMQDTLETILPLTALNLALAQRGRPRKVLHHSDRGCQYASLEYRQVLTENELIASMSRRANCYDNAAMESFWSTLKTELRDEHLELLPKAVVRQIVFEYIESYYNRQRLHSSLGYRSPVEFEQN
jgi:transposase InsO family protein